MQMILSIEHTAAYRMGKDFFLTNSTSFRGLVSKIYKELKKIPNNHHQQQQQKTNNVIWKWGTETENSQ